MKREKVFNRSLLILAIMSIMLFAMTITASAASAVTGLEQSGDSNTSVEVKWNANNSIGERYRLAYDTSRTGSFSNTTYTTSDTKLRIYGLQTGCTYYVKVQTMVGNKVAAETSPIQVVTSPNYVDYKSIKQTSGTKNKIGLSWNSVSGVSGYLVAKYDGTKLNEKASFTVKTNKATISAQAGNHYNGYRIITYKISESGYVALSDYYASTGTLYAAAVNPQYLADAKAGTLVWKPATKGNVITIGWKPNPNYDRPSGYQVQIYSIDGKKRLYTTKVTTKREITINNAKLRKAINNRGFKVRIRSYQEANGGVKCWSDWSAFKTIVPQACIKSGKAVSNSAAKVYWKKVANAKYYVVYYRKNTRSSKWTKKKVSAKTTSYVIRGLKKYQTFEVYTIPVVKVGGKTYRGSQCERYAAYIGTVYY